MDENRKELARLKREATEIAAKIHDIVEESLFTDYRQLKPLSEELIAKCEEFDAIKNS